MVVFGNAPNSIVRSSGAAVNIIVASTNRQESRLWPKAHPLRIQKILTLGFLWVYKV